MSTHDEAEILYRRRKYDLQMTQDEVAAEAGINKQQYQRYEKGITKLSKAAMETGLRICLALELNPYEVVFEDWKDMVGKKG
jgi:DNA-binding XRE family transcriptional regulator